MVFKRMLFTLLVLCSYNFANAQDLKLYVATVDPMSYKGTNFLSQVIVCNNYLDTFYVKMDDLNTVRPHVTNDLSTIVDGGSRFLVTGTKNMEEDLSKLATIIKKEVDTEKEAKEIKRKKFINENYELPYVNRNGEKYYVIYPRKCLTINSNAKFMDLELARLHKITKEERKSIQAYLTIPVDYYTSGDNTIRNRLLVSRESDELKKALFFYFDK